jgi:hypothetical protein
MPSPFSERPESMHHKTFSRLQSELSRAEVQGFTILVGRLGVTLRGWIVRGRFWKKLERNELKVA